MEPITTAITAAGAYLGLKDLIPRILGPSADYLGGELKSYTEKGSSNLKRIFESAGEKLGESLNEPGQVSPKVLKDILSEGYFAEDELATEYFGGVLASSRTSISRDDRGAAFVKLVSRLSVYQLRMHHIFYSTVKKRHAAKTTNVFFQAERKATLGTYISFSQFVAALDFHIPEDPTPIVPHVVHGLIRESLLEDDFQYGPPEHLKKTAGITVTEGGLWLFPTPLGFELMLWAEGKGSLDAQAVLGPKVELKPLPNIKYPE